MTTQNGRAFNEWLRAQLKAKKMSQRQLAQQSGVDHSTISRLIRGDRMPSLGTATKLARGLRELRDDADTPQYLGLVASGVDEPDRPRRVRAARRRPPVASRRSARSWSTTSPSGCAASAAHSHPAARPGRARGTRGSERSMGAPLGGNRSMASGRVGGVTPGGSIGVTDREHRAARLARPRPGDRPLLAHLRARSGSPSTVRVSGTANAGVWGAGVRDFRAGHGLAGRRRAVHRDEAPGGGLEAVEERTPRRAHPRPASRDPRPGRRTRRRSTGRKRSSQRRTSARSGPALAPGATLPGARPDGVVGDDTDGRGGQRVGEGLGRLEVQAPSGDGRSRPGPPRPPRAPHRPDRRPAPQRGSRRQGGPPAGRGQGSSPRGPPWLRPRVPARAVARTVSARAATPSPVRTTTSGSAKAW